MQSSKQAVTVAITHHVKPGFEEAFEEWIRGVSQFASGFRGYRGYVVLPKTEASTDRHVALRFDSMKNLNDYWECREAGGWRDRLKDIVSEPSEIQPEIGIEHWCMAPGSAGPPSRHRMAVVVFLAILPLVTFIPPVLKPWLGGFVPSWLAGVMTTATLVLIMSYLAMPIATRLLRGWLQPAPI